MENGIAAHRIAHGDEALRACVPDDEGKIAFKALQAFEPAIAIDGESKRGIVVAVCVQRRQAQTGAQLLPIIETTHQHGVYVGNCRLRHQPWTIRQAVIAHVKFSLAAANADSKPDSHGTAPWELGLS